MAQVPDRQGVPTEAPNPTPPEDYQHIEPRAAEGLQAFGQGLSTAGKFFGQVAADNTYNNATTAATNLSYGDPTKSVPGPDGTMVPDTGFFGLKGDAALRAAPGYQKNLDKIFADARKGLGTPEEQLQFDTFSRRYRVNLSERVGEHLDRQQTFWATTVNDAGKKNAFDQIANDPFNPKVVAAGAADAANFAAKQAMLAGATPGDDVWKSAVDGAKRDALKVQVQAIGATDPTTALRILNKNRTIAGTDYDNLYADLKTRADKQSGTAYSAGWLTKRTSDKAAAAAASPTNPDQPYIRQAVTDIPGGFSTKGVARTIALESGGRPITNDSGHMGQGQFSSDTWARFGAGGNPDNPADAAAAVQRYAAYNARILTPILGRPPTDAELYLAHQQGGVGAARLLSHPGATAASLIGRQAVIQNGGSPDMTAAQFTAMWTHKFDGTGPAASVAKRGAPAVSASNQDGVQLFDPETHKPLYPGVPTDPKTGMPIGDASAPGLATNPDGTLASPDQVETPATTPEGVQEENHPAPAAIEDNAPVVKQIQSGIRSRPIQPALSTVLTTAAAATDPGVKVVVYSGGQGPRGTPGARRTGSTRHDNGNAGDVYLYRNGKLLDFRNPADLPYVEKFVTAAFAAGATGIGAGPGYMGAGIHVGYGPNGVKGGPRMVWGAKGASSNAPGWLRAAASGAPISAGGEVVPDVNVATDAGGGLRRVPSASRENAAVVASGGTLRANGAGVQVASTDNTVPGAPAPTGVAPPAPDGDLSPPPPTPEQQAEQPAPLSELAQGYRDIAASDLTPEAKQYAFEALRQQLAAEQVAADATATQRKNESDKAADGYMTQLLGGSAGPTLLSDIAKDTRLTWETKESLTRAAEAHSENTVSGASAAFGPGFWSAYKQVSAPVGDPSRISDVAAVLNRAGPGGDLTLAGVQKLVTIMGENTRSVDDQAVNTTKMGLIAYAKSRLSNQPDTGTITIKDPEGERIFNARFIPKFESAFDQWKKAGKDPWQFLTQENTDKLMQGLRSPTEMALQKIHAQDNQDTSTFTAPPPPTGVNPEGWKLVMNTPPPQEDGTALDPGKWQQVVERLVANPTPGVRNWFDKYFEAKGLRADDVLDALGVPKELQKGPDERQTSAPIASAPPAPGTPAGPPPPAAPFNPNQPLGDFTP